MSSDGPNDPIVRPASRSTLRPTYAAAFRCIGDRCEDNCCSDWAIPLDRATYERYRQFPPEKLGAVVAEFVTIRPAPRPDEMYATIQRRATGVCPFFGEDHLCGVQAEYGAALLSATCSIFPRSLSAVGDALEGSLSLSCPEAARNVLLDPAFLQTEGDLLNGGFRTDNVYRLASDKTGFADRPYAAFGALRQWIVDTLRERSVPLWHRLMEVGAVCRGLEDPTSLDLRIQGQRTDWDSLPSRPGVKLDFFFELGGAVMNDSTGSRFRETFGTFVDGLGREDPAMPGDYIDRFSQVAQRYYRPFLASRPYLLENYLVNYVFQHLFPYGRVGSAEFPSRSVFEQFLLLATQFAWIETMLIGMAGYYREAFAEEHVVLAVQSLTRELEHNRAAHDLVLALMRQRKMVDPAGVAILLRT
jgi:lysine-N-methylase